MGVTMPHREEGASAKAPRSKHSLSESIFCSAHYLTSGWVSRCLLCGCPKPHSEGSAHANECRLPLETQTLVGGGPGSKGCLVPL